MTYEDAEAWKQFIRTANATTNALLHLINDLVPTIGLNEAQRLVDIIGKAQKGEET